MSEKPRKGDKVRVMVEGRYLRSSVNHDSSDHVIDSFGDEYTVPHYAEVEILERADDPANDPYGTYRRQSISGAVAVKISYGGADIWFADVAKPVGYHHYRGNREMGNWPIIGYLPGCEPK